uniref:Protein kinase domain-containing protein n=1 Tax=Globisporangium ultimum (strain ATCC 200006 / CBS 805.95 / DAOM BR144) TaxID=431595 RepID=K3WI76_GLOUD
MCSSLVVYLRYKRHEAFQGDANAARKLILPAFEPLLWIMTLLSGMTFVSYVVMLFGQVNFALVPQWVVYFFRSCNYFVFLIIPVLMLQKSISKAALRRACGITVLIATYQIPIEWAVHKLMASGLTPSQFDLVTPPARASKRTLREYCACVGTYHGIQMVVYYFAERREKQTELFYVSIRNSGRQQLAWDITVKGTVDYMAPEVIQGRAGLASYGEAADIYSLGVTFWDILHPGQEKFPHLKSNHLHIFEAILDGERPRLDPRNADLYADLYHVIELAWQGEPEQRPSAQQLVMLLERIQEQECARFARDFSYDVLVHMDPETFSSVSHRGSSHVSEDGFHVRGQQRVQTTGRHAVATMLQQQVVQSRPEAVRLGNLLMDAGVLHHVKHGRPFEDNGSASSSQVYYFDHNCIQMYEPPTISILEEEPTPEQREDLASSTGMKHITHGLLRQDAPSTLRLPPRALQTVRADADSTALLSDCPSRPCGCRALSQRLQQPKVPMYHKVLRKFKGHTLNMTTPLLEAHSLTANLFFANDDRCYDGGALDEDDCGGGSFTVHVQE